MNLKVKTCRPGAKMPKYTTSGAACFDLHAVMDQPTELYAGTTVIIPTGLIFDIPEGYALMVYSRSGHGFNYDVRLSNATGVIDSDYTGEVMVKLRRDGCDWYKPFIVSHGDRIAQAMLIPVQKMTIEQVEDVKETERGIGGMGSTGA